MKVESFVLRVGNTHLYTSSAGGGYPLVLVHGLAGSGRWWARNVPVLARYFRVLTVDLAGFGHSSGQPFDLETAAGLLSGWMDAMEIERCHLMGHSMGGYIAAELAAIYPDRVNQLALVDAVVLPLHRSLISSSLHLAWTVRYMSPDFLPVLVSDTLRAGPRVLYRAIRDINRISLTEALQRIRADLLIVWGEQDKLLPLEMGRELHRKLPAARFEVVRGAGHNPMWDRPRAFNQIICRFFLGEPHNEPGSGSSDQK